MIHGAFGAAIDERWKMHAATPLSSKKNRVWVIRRADRRVRAASDAMPAVPGAPHVAVLRQGVSAWNAWRRANPGIVPDLNDLDVSISERQFGRTQGGPINFSLTEFRRARLDQATLTEANLMGAVLVEADLAGAHLEKADLRGANLARANLRGARLEGANLRGADLGLARGLEQAQIDGAIGDRRTVLPADLTKPKAWLEGDGPDAGQAARRGRLAKLDGDREADPYEVLGVAPETPIQDIRVAWLRLVNELERNESGERSASERLHAINEAYRTLKKREYQESQQRLARSSRCLLAVILLAAAIAVGGLVAAVETRLARTGDPGRAVPAARASPEDVGMQSPPPGQQAPAARGE